MFPAQVDLINQHWQFPSKSSLLLGAIIITVDLKKQACVISHCSLELDDSSIMLCSAQRYHRCGFWVSRTHLCWCGFVIFLDKQGWKPGVLWLMRYRGSGNDGFNYCPGLVQRGWLLKSMLSVLGWEFRPMPVLLCLAAFDAHSPLLYSHIVLIRFFAADASLHLCSNQCFGQREA